MVLRNLLLVLAKAASVKGAVATVATVGVCTTAVVAGTPIVTAITTPDTSATPSTSAAPSAAPSVAPSASATPPASAPATSSASASAAPSATASGRQSQQAPAPKTDAEGAAGPTGQLPGSGKSGADGTDADTGAAHSTAPPSPDTNVVAPTAGDPAAPRQQSRVVVVGDSITEMDSPNFDAGVIGRHSWASFVQDSDAAVVGGWAHAGATTADMLAGLDASAPLQADVLVIMAGNNDVDDHVSTAKILHSLTQIAGKVHADRVVLSTLAPEDADVGSEIQEVNSALPALAQQQGWQLVDPMQDIRDGDEHYLPGMTDDGVHPSSPAAGIVGRALQQALTAATATAD